MRTKKIIVRNVINKRSTFCIFLLLLIQQIVVIVTLARKTSAPVKSQDLHIKASFYELNENSPVYDGYKHIGFLIDNTASVPLSQSAVKQNTEAAIEGSQTPNGVIQLLTTKN